jgi:hypothetical protein
MSDTFAEYLKKIKMEKSFIEISKRESQEIYGGSKIVFKSINGIWHRLLSKV